MVIIKYDPPLGMTSLSKHQPSFVPILVGGNIQNLGDQFKSRTWSFDQMESFILWIATINTSSNRTGSMVLWDIATRLHGTAVVHAVNPITLGKKSKSTHISHQIRAYWATKMIFCY